MSDAYLVLRLSLEETQWLRKIMLLLDGQLQLYDDKVRRGILVKLRDN